MLIILLQTLTKTDAGIFDLNYLLLGVAILALLMLSGLLVGWIKLWQIQHIELQIEPSDLQLIAYENFSDLSSLRQKDLLHR